MRKIIGIVALCFGIMLLVWGHDSAGAFNSQVKNIFTGTPTDRTMYFYIGGAALVLYGLVQIAWQRKK
jgi:hypothetical protein